LILRANFGFYQVAGYSAFYFTPRRNGTKNRGKLEIPLRLRAFA
jgi:hypothetical protein